jgi:acyl-CoA thioester hydrolase
MRGRTDHPGESSGAGGRESWSALDVPRGVQVSFVRRRVQNQAEIDMQQVLREHFNFFHPLRVRWAEVDSQGIVFNPHYLAYCDIAFNEYLRAIGFPYPAGLAEFGTDVFAVHSEINFRGSAVYDDDLDLGARVSRIGRTSLTLTIGIFRREMLLCDVVNTYVNGARDTKRPVPVPEAFIEAITAFEKVPPERKVAS